VRARNIAVAALKETREETMIDHKRRVFRTEDLTDEQIALIAKAEVPAEYAHLDAELGEEYMVSLCKDDTGIDHTVFVSTKADYTHAARIVIAAEPTLNPHSKSASMLIEGDGIMGVYLPPHIVEQAQQFIGRNRDVLLRYWNCETSTKQLLDGLKPPAIHTGEITDELLALNRQHEAEASALYPNLDTAKPTGN
jgi:hypothetical protein